jgi:chemotaxis response regulator CheB
MVNGTGQRRGIPVIGASAGGVTALQELFAALPDPLPGVIAAVLHRSPFFESLLPMVLGFRTRSGSWSQRRRHGSSGVTSTSHRATVT